MSENPDLRLDRATPIASKDTRRERVAARFRDDYIHYQYCIVEYLCTHLVDCAAAFSGDLDKVLILALIGQVHMRERLDAATRRGEGPCDAVAASAITASRLADVSRIPRQTVRRKLEELAASGHIEQTEAGWRLKLVGGASSTRKNLAALDAKAIDNAARLFVGLEAVVGGA